ncbi:unnamed protein product [Knipowitschia caucasica]
MSLFTETQGHAHIPGNPEVPTPVVEKRLFYYRLRQTNQTNAVITFPGTLLRSRSFLHVYAHVFHITTYFSLTFGGRKKCLRTTFHSGAAV